MQISVLGVPIRPSKAVRVDLGFRPRPDGLRPDGRNDMSDGI